MNGIEAKQQLRWEREQQEFVPVGLTARAAKLLDEIDREREHLRRTIAAGRKPTGSLNRLREYADELGRELGVPR